MLKDALNALLRLLTAVGAFFAGFRTGVLSERVKDAENAIDAVKKANKARVRFRALSDDDKLRELREGGYVRDDATDNSK